MTALKIAQVLASKPAGSFFTVDVRRPGKTRKGVSDRVEKFSTYQGMVTDYARRTPVKEAVESGARLAPELPGHILESFFVGDIRFWRGKSGKEYFPVNVTGNAAKAQWYLNGSPVTLDSIKELLLAEEYRVKPTKEAVEAKGQVIFNAITLENVSDVR